MGAPRPGSSTSKKSSRPGSSLPQLTPTQNISSKAVDMTGDPQIDSDIGTAP